LKYSPAKIENLLRGWFGGSSQYALEASDYLLNSIKREADGKTPEKPKSITELPLIRGFTVRTPSETGQSQSINDFYDKAKKIEQTKASADSLMKNKDTKGLKEILKENPKIYSYYKIATQTKQKLSEIDTKINRIMEDAQMSAEKKKNYLASLEKQRVLLAQKANAIINK